MNKHKLGHYIIKTGLLAVLIYSSASLAIQVAADKDIEYSIIAFIVIGIILYGIMEAYDDTLR